MLHSHDGAAHDCVQRFGHCTFLSLLEFSDCACLFFCLGISIKVSVVVESSTGLSTTNSTLEYSAMKEDTGAKFECRADGLPLESSSVNFTITCESLSKLCLKPFILLLFLPVNSKKGFKMQDDHHEISKSLRSV